MANRPSFPRPYWLVALLCLAVPSPMEAAEPSKLSAICHGAAGEISGSLFVLDTGNGRWMIDCGSVIDEDADRAGDETTKDKKKDEKAADKLPKGVESVKALFLTHAHVDHLGRLPLLIERGFRGPIYMTEATAALAVPALRVQLYFDRTTVRDWTWSKEKFALAERKHKSVYFHWHDCKYRKAILSKNEEQAKCTTQELRDRFEGKTSPIKVIVCSECIDKEVAALLRRAKPLKYDAPKEIAPGVCATFLDAGHIPGSASVMFEVTLGKKKRRVLFSGDLGNGLSPLFPLPKPVPESDAVFVDTTYGPISRKASVSEQRPEFRRAVADAVKEKGVAWIPCYCMDRTQKILYELHLAQKEKLLPKSLPIYCPSPTAKEITALYGKHRKKWFPPEIAAGAFSPHEIETTVPSEKQLPRPCIVISTGNFLETPWMRRLLSTLLTEPTTHMLFVAYQPRGSAGALLLDGATKLEIDGNFIPVHAKVHPFSCFSGHADASQIDTWLGDVPKESTIVLIHGEKEDLEARAEQLRSQGRRVLVAKPGKAINLESAGKAKPQEDLPQKNAENTEKSAK